MRRASIVAASALVVLVVLAAWARWDALHPAATPPVDPADLTPGQDQARVVVREIRLIHGGEDDELEDDPVDATQGAARIGSFAFLVELDLQKVLRGRFPRQSVRILVHSPSADLGVSRPGEHGVLHRRREGSGGRYWFRPESHKEG
ncbi:MAG: hypothetical protein ACYC61_22725 [Isosphaeraceae bacterium]